MNILLAADGSDYTKQAARFLAKQLKGYREPPELHVLHVHAMLPFPGAAATLGKKAIDDYYRDESKAALAVADKPLDKAGIAHQSKWMVGDAAEVIASYVKKHDIDLVVMGSHGHGGLASLVMGSTTTKVLARVKVPVLIVR
jgi:nucleotide-binding universal stress UspA family protein